MSRTLVTEVSVPREQLDREAARVALRALLARSFSLVPADLGSARYWLDAARAWIGAESLDDSLPRFGDGQEWSIALLSRSSSDDPVYVTFSVVADGQRNDPFWKVSLSTSVSSFAVESALSQQFLSWSVFLAGLVGAHYGWGGSDLGLFNRETTPIAQPSLRALDPQPLEWLNVYGSAYVDKLGRDRLLTTPAWRVEFVADGAIAVTLADHPYRVSEEDARRVAAHLGVPLQEPPG